MSYPHIQGLVAIREEFEAARAALDYAVALNAKIVDIPEFVGVKSRTVVQARRDVEGTYLIRLFAEFESVLRNFRQAIRPRRRPVRIDVERLVNSIATPLHMDALDRERVHDVRRYRNALVHTGGGVRLVDFSDAFRYLCKFLYWLP